MIKRLLCLAAALLIPAAWACADPAPVTQPGRPEVWYELPVYQTYELLEAHEVDGRQGVAWEDEEIWVSGSATLSRYDSEWRLLARNDDPFADLGGVVNHIGDIDVFDGEIYAGVEYFMDGAASDIRIAVYDAQTLAYLRSYPFEPASGQTECSGIAVDGENRLVWLCSWEDGESGRYLYRYDLDSGEYLGKAHLQPVPQWIQGIACYGGTLFLTADDGTADLGEPDHLYRCEISADGTAATVLLERTFDDVALQGEIEGLSFDRENAHLLVLYNRGSRIVLGMVKGFYEGYEREIHEVYRYQLAD